MLEKVSARNFQSLHGVELELDRFTVVVGQSSSGKSAFTRAIRTLVCNARGTSFITHGETTATITAKTDAGTVSLSKGKKDEYTLILNDEAAERQVFTKLGGEVPEPVTKFLGIEPKDPINFAGQFDMPYLLKASPSEVARILGELTNAHIVFEAARESNRRRLQASSTLRTRASDLSEIQQKAQEYAQLRAHLDAIASAEAHMATARELRERIKRLSTLVFELEEAQVRVGEVSEDAAIELPDLTAVTEAVQRLARFRSELTKVTEAKKNVQTALRAHGNASIEETELEQAYLDALRVMGSCPTCGQDTKELTHAH